jgi:hypothetical protein
MDVGMADAGQGFVMSPCTERRRTPSSGRLWHRPWHMGNSPWQMDVDHDGQDATSDRMDDFQGTWQLDRLVWHVWHDAGGPGGATFHCSFGGYLALRGLTSHLRGLTSCLFAHFGNLACKK